jgi:hypothetical protein
MDIAEKLIKIGAELEDASRREVGIAWAAATRELRSLQSAKPDGGTDPLQQFLAELGDVRVLQSAADLFLADQWIDALSARMSYSYIQQLQLRRNEIRKLLNARRDELQVTALQSFLADEDHAAIIRRGTEILGQSTTEQTQGDLRLRGSFEPPLFKALLSLTDASAQLSPEEKRAVLRDMRSVVLKSREVEEDPSVHPVVKMGLTYGLVPGSRMLEPPEQEENVLIAALPGSRAVLYDLQTLLQGVGGTPMSGVNFSLARELETIRYLDSAKAPAQEPAQGLARLDITSPAASACARTLTPGRGEPKTLAQYMRGPSPSLASYHRLNEAVLSDEAEGCALSNLDKVMEVYVSGDVPVSKNEAARESRELTLVGKQVADRAAEEGESVWKDATMMAEDLALRRHEYMQRNLTTALTTNALPGSELCRQRELDLSVILQCKRLRRGLAKTMAHKNKSGRREALESFLTGEGATSASLKMTALVLGRPGGLR